MKTLVIGLDGGEWDVINPLIREGKLPNIKRLKEDGIHGSLESTTPPVSPPAWNTIQTGTNPGKHGIFDFSTFDEKYNRHSVSASDRNATPFWKIMNDYGESTGIFKVPFTYPPTDIDGFLVTGFPTPNTVNDFAVPQSLAETVGPIEDLFEDWSLNQPGKFEEFKDNLLDVAERQTNLFLKLMQEYDNDFQMTVYDGSDRIQHFFWKYFDESHPRYEYEPSLARAIEEYYVMVDDSIGRIIEKNNKENNIMLISDHGFGPLSYDIYIDEWLESEGFISRRGEESTKQRTHHVLASLMKKGWNAVRSIGAEDIVKSILPASWFDIGSSLQNESHRDTIWEDTQAFFTTLSGQSFYVNLEDRFAAGSVPQRKYDNIVSELADSILSIRHPETGEKLVREAVPANEVYEGWSVEKGPDLIVLTAPNYTMKGGRSEELVQPSTQHGVDRSGDHRKEGILIAHGPSFGDGTFNKASVADIAPTLLHLQKCPVPTIMDGSVLTGILSESVVSNRTIEMTEEYGDSRSGERRWTEEEEAELEERLSEMGYLE